MLTKAARVSRLGRQMLVTPARSIITHPNKNWIEPESVEDLVEFLDTKQPQFACVYFHAAWNPICEQINVDYDNFTSNNHSFTHIKVDCDKTPKVKLYFDARVEPQFLMLLNGAEIKRQIGFNFNLVENHLEAIKDFHLS